MIDWLVGCYIGWLVNWINDWLTDWINEWMTNWMNEWMNEWMNCWLVGCCCQWVPGWATDLLADWWTVWLAGWLSEWVSCCSCSSSQSVSQSEPHEGNELTLVQSISHEHPITVVIQWDKNIGRQRFHNMLTSCCSLCKEGLQECLAGDLSPMRQSVKQLHRLKVKPPRPRHHRALSV